ncbi:hypothetical protein GCM10011321_15670 [Youhaiella tibetensis]|uniref:Uncharacterized protein n=1 Tax=Paradevosia tibetensis TaxID=1447062 RepID=A0A5B9DLX4_9HYPH|nr:hypothetical protein [Youhaiella tibetensis]QEE20331.1 hypothetical protein FNA67_09160 [Youhaiella tibetensis]GGF25114.1 hypothetical protein GCM10011321_15670 [Youhaiella tibetensis]
MRFIAPFALALLLVTPAVAEDCAPLAERVIQFQDTATNLVNLVQARPVDWRSVNPPADKRQDYANLRKATDAMLPALQRFVATGKPATQAIEDCKRYRAGLPAGQVAILRSALIASDALVPLLVRYLVAYDAATGGPASIETR